MDNWKNLLLVAGTNRNVGKTTFACKIIESLSKNHEVIAVKITSHFHSTCASCNIIHKAENLIIAEELSNKTPKDSSKMLAFGASKVYYVQTTDEKLNEVLDILEPLLPKNKPIVCESAALHKIVQPGLFVVLSGDKEPVKNIETIKQANIYFKDFNFEFDNIVFKDGYFGCAQ